jgi:hypothetical protein
MNNGASHAAGLIICGWHARDRELALYFEQGRLMGHLQFLVSISTKDLTRFCLLAHWC